MPERCKFLSRSSKVKCEDGFELDAYGFLFAPYTIYPVGTYLCRPAYVDLLANSSSPIVCFAARPKIGVVGASGIFSSQEWRQIKTDLGGLLLRASAPIYPEIFWSVARAVSEILVKLGI